MNSSFETLSAIGRDSIKAAGCPVLSAEGVQREYEVRVELGGAYVRFGEKRIVIDVDDEGIWFKDEQGRMGYAPCHMWLRWIGGRR